MLELAVLVSALFALLAAVFGWQLGILHNAIALLFLAYGLMSFPYSKGDRWQVTLAVGCVCFIVAGSLAILTRNWWPLPLGCVLGMSIGSYPVTLFLLRMNPMEVDAVVSELEKMARAFQTCRQPV